MEFEVWRVYDGVRVLEKHQRLTGSTRGKLVITQPQDPVRHRAVLVACLAASHGHRAIAPLHDVVLVGSTGETWTLAGYERVEAGPMRYEIMVGQAWMLELAAVEDLMARSASGALPRRKRTSCASVVSQKFADKISRRSRGCRRQS